MGEVDVIGMHVYGCGVVVYGDSHILYCIVDGIQLLGAIALDDYFACPLVLKTDDGFPGAWFKALFRRVAGEGNLGGS